jgi:hypothetical protein
VTRTRRVHWHKRPHLDWNDGYVVLLRVEVALSHMGQRDRQLESVLNGCRKAVLREMRYTIEEPRP